MVRIVLIFPVICCSPCLRDNRTAQVSSNVESILSDPNSALVWMVFILPLICCSPCLSNNKTFQVSSNVQSILADLNSAVVWMVLFFFRSVVSLVSVTIRLLRSPAMFKVFYLILTVLGQDCFYSSSDLLFPLSQWQQDTSGLQQCWKYSSWS